MAKRPRRARPRQMLRSGRRPARSIATPTAGNRRAGKNVLQRDIPGRMPAPETEGSGVNHSPKSGSAGGDYSPPSYRHDFRKSARDESREFAQARSTARPNYPRPRAIPGGSFAERSDRDAEKNTSRGRCPALPFQRAGHRYRGGEARAPAASPGNRCQKRRFANTRVSVLLLRADFRDTSNSWDRKKLREAFEASLLFPTTDAGSDAERREPIPAGAD